MCEFKQAMGNVPGSASNSGIGRASMVRTRTSSSGGAVAAGGVTIESNNQLISAGGGTGRTVMENLPMNALEDMPDRFRETYFPMLPKTWRVCRKGVHDDGSCWYHSLAIATNFQGAATKEKVEQVALGHKLRAMLRDTIPQDEKQWIAFWEERGVDQSHVPTAKETRKKLSNPTVWADLWAAYYTFVQLKSNVLFYDAMAARFYCGVTVDDRKNALAAGGLPSVDHGLIVICWIRRSHFEPIVLVRTEATDTNSTELADHPFAYRSGGDGALQVSVLSGKLRRHLLEVYHTGTCKQITLGDIAMSQAGGGAMQLARHSHEALVVASKENKELRQRIAGLERVLHNKGLESTRGGHMPPLGS